jgi:hypothetical protein
MEHKVRLSIVLPVVQVLVTATLTVWANSVDWIVFGESNRIPDPRFVRLNTMIVYLRLIWRGVNAPAFPFSIVSAYQSVSLGNLLYLIAVGTLWYGVGKSIDRQRGLGPAVEATRQTKFTWAALTIWGFLLLGFFVLDLYDSLHLLPEATKQFNFFFVLRNRPWVVPTQMLFLLWSLILIVVPGTQLLTARPLTRVESSQGTSANPTPNR